MFTLEQVKAAHAKTKSGSDFPAYVQDIKALGVVSYHFYVTDGHTDYYGAENYTCAGPAMYPQKEIAVTSSAEALQHTLTIHQQGQTDFATFCEQAAAGGTEKWVVDTYALTCTYYTTGGDILIEESIPLP